MITRFILLMLVADGRLVMVRASESSLRIENDAENKEVTRSKPCELAKTFVRLLASSSPSQNPARRRHPLEQLLWIVAVSVCIWGTAIVGQRFLARYQSTPTSVTIERNHLDWTTNFPALVVCPEPSFSNEAIQLVLERYNVTDTTAFTEFFKELSTNSYLGWKDKLKTPFREVDPNEFGKIVLEITRRIEFDVVGKFGGNEYSNTSLLTPRILLTEVGICYFIHSLSAPYGENGFRFSRRVLQSEEFCIERGKSVLPPDSGHNPVLLLIQASIRQPFTYNGEPYWDSGNWTYLPEYRPYSANQIDGDSYIQLVHLPASCKLYFLDSYEIVDEAMPYTNLTFLTFKTVDMKAVSIVSDPSLQQMSISQRKCRFPSESNLLTSPAYSYYRCRQECRMKLSRELCGCVAYFYRPTEGFTFCDFDGYQCLGRHGRLIHFLMNDEKRIDCNCEPLCSETQYTILVDNTMDWGVKAHLKCGMVRYPRMRYKRIVVFGLTDLIVKAGAAAFVFLGFNFLGVAKFLYFLSARYVKYLYNGNSSKGGMSLSGKGIDRKVE